MATATAATAAAAGVELVCPVRSLRKQPVDKKSGSSDSVSAWNSMSGRDDDKKGAWTGAAGKGWAWS